MYGDHVSHSRMIAAYRFFHRCGQQLVSLFGDEYAEAQYWWLFMALRGFDQHNEIGIRELRQECANLTESEIETRLRNVDKWLVDVESDHRDKPLSIQCRQIFYEKYDELIKECMSGLLEITSDNVNVPNTASRTEIPVSRAVFEEFELFWTRYYNSWKRVVHDMTASEAHDKSTEEMRIRIYSKESHWLTVFALFQSEEGDRVLHEWLTKDQILRKGNQIASLTRAGVDKALSDLSRTGVIETRKTPKRNEYRSRADQHEIYREHILETVAGVDRVGQVCAEILGKKS